jgi:hypothetical protein
MSHCMISISAHLSLPISIFESSLLVFTYTMRFTTALLSLIIPAALVAAEITDCDEDSGGPSQAEVSVALDAFIQKFAPDGVYHPQRTQFIPISSLNCLLALSTTRGSLTFMDYQRVKMSASAVAMQNSEDRTVAQHPNTKHLWIKSERASADFLTVRMGAGAKFT